MISILTESDLALIIVIVSDYSIWNNNNAYNYNWSVFTKDFTNKYSKHFDVSKEFQKDS